MHTSTRARSQSHLNNRNVRTVCPDLRVLFDIPSPTQNVFSGLRRSFDVIDDHPSVGCFTSSLRREIPYLLPVAVWKRDWELRSSWTVEPMWFRRGLDRIRRPGAGFILFSAVSLTLGRARESFVAVAGWYGVEAPGRMWWESPYTHIAGGNLQVRAAVQVSNGMVRSDEIEAVALEASLCEWLVLRADRVEVCACTHGHR